MLTRVLTWQREPFGKGSGHTLCSNATCLQQAVSTSTTKKYVQWFAQWKTVHTDSTVTKSVINKEWSRNAYVNRLLRKMAWSCAKLNCKLKAVHVAGVINILPDTISRLHEKGKIHYLIQLLSHWHNVTIPLPHLQDHVFINAVQVLVARCGQPE